jgi:hypothetical protein
MALVASALIDFALQRTYGAQGRQKISKAMLLSELSYQDQLIVQMFSQIAPDLLATTTGSITLTDAGNTNGYTLQSGIHYRDFVHTNVDDEKYNKITMIRRQDRESYPAPPAGMLRMGSVGGVFAPVDHLGKRWTGTEQRSWFDPDAGHAVTYSYVALPSALTAMSDTLASPDMAREVFISSLELTILLSQTEVNEIKVQAALAKRQGMMDSLRMQMYKFVGPQGEHGRGRARTESDWVNDQVG